MSPSFHLDLGPFAFTLSIDSDGIAFERGSTKQYFDWRRIAGAVLVCEERNHGKEDRELALARAFFGENFDLEKIKALRDSMATIHIAYCDDGGRLTHEQFPIPLADGAFLQEVRERLGSRWLGEVADAQAAEKKLHTAPGPFKILFFLFIFLVVVALALAFGLFTLLAPALNVLSIREMYFEFVDGDYSALGTHVLVYVALFVFAHLLRRAWRTRVETRRARNRPLP